MIHTIHIADLEFQMTDAEMVAILNSSDSADNTRTEVEMTTERSTTPSPGIPTQGTSTPKPPGQDKATLLAPLKLTWAPQRLATQWATFFPRTQGQQGITGFTLKMRLTIKGMTGHIKLPTRKISDIWDIDVSDPEFNPIRTKSLIDMCNTHTKVIPAFRAVSRAFPRTTLSSWRIQYRTQQTGVRKRNKVIAAETSSLQTSFTPFFEGRTGYKTSHIHVTAMLRVLRPTEHRLGHRPSKRQRRKANKENRERMPPQNPAFTQPDSCPIQDSQLRTVGFRDLRERLNNPNVNLSFQTNSALHGISMSKPPPVFGTLPFQASSKGYFTSHYQASRHQTSESARDASVAYSHSQAFPGNPFSVTQRNLAPLSQSSTQSLTHTNYSVPPPSSHGTFASGARSQNNAEPIGHFRCHRDREPKAEEMRTPTTTSNSSTSPPSTDHSPQRTRRTLLPIPIFRPYL